MKATKSSKQDGKASVINNLADTAIDIPERSEPVNEPTFGVVTCALLNVRESPDADADVTTTIHKGHKLMVDVNASTDDFYSVCTETGVEGYCMKQFIEV